MQTGRRRFSKSFAGTCLVATERVSETLVAFQLNDRDNTSSYPFYQSNHFKLFLLPVLKILFFASPIFLRFVLQILPTGSCEETTGNRIQSTGKNHAVIDVPSHYYGPPELSFCAVWKIYLTAECVQYKPLILAISI